MYQLITFPELTPDGAWYGKQQIEIQYDGEEVSKVWYKGVDIFPILEHLQVKIPNVYANTHP